MGAGTGIDESPAGLQAAYPQLWQETYEAAYANAHAHRLVTLVIDQRPGVEDPVGRRVYAMDGAKVGPRPWKPCGRRLTDSGVEERSYQWDVLANLERP